MNRWMERVNRWDEMRKSGFSERRGISVQKEIKLKMQEHDAVENVLLSQCHVFFLIFSMKFPPVLM